MEHLANFSRVKKNKNFYVKVQSIDSALGAVLASHIIATEIGDEYIFC